MTFFDFTFYNFVLDIYKKSVIVMCIKGTVPEVPSPKS